MFEPTTSRDPRLSFQTASNHIHIKPVSLILFHPLVYFKTWIKIWFTFATIRPNDCQAFIPIIEKWNFQLKLGILEVNKFGSLDVAKYLYFNSLCYEVSTVFAF